MYKDSRVNIGLYGTDFKILNELLTLTSTLTLTASSIWDSQFCGASLTVSWRIAVDYHH